MKNRLLALALVAAVVPAANATLTTTALSSDPATSAAYASASGNSLYQPLTGFTVDNRNSTSDYIASLTWAVNADDAIGYTGFNLQLKGGYIAPSQFDSNGDPVTVIQIGGAAKTFDDNASLLPVSDLNIPYYELPVASTYSPYALNLNLVNPYAVTNGHVEVEFYVFVPAGTFFTLDEATVVANPVPEPATMAVLGVGALGLLRRRKKS